MSEKYNPQKIESKWQKYWEKEKLFEAQDNSKKEKYYALVEFPYPSGDGLHVGHLRSYIALDAIARKRRMQDYNVLYPMGWDAFGLPAENYAIKTGIHPKITTEKNCKIFKSQCNSVGLSFDWSREINTTNPEYYKWTQWIFLKLFEKGLAYKAEMAINFCLDCKVGLANEEVVNGKCERCGGEVVQKTKKQWMLKITKYADRLEKDLDKIDYLEKIKLQQKNWIGRSQGVNFNNKVKDIDIEFEVYDSIPQTHMAQTFIVMAPEHPMVEQLVKDTKYEKSVMKWIDKIIKKKATNKFDIEKDKDGIFTGRYVEDWMSTGRDLPIWVASFALIDYGTGIVNCSVHDERDFEFAKKHNIPLHPVLFPKDREHAKKVESTEVFYREPDGILREPEEFAGKRWDEVREPMIDWLVKKGKATKAINYKLRDWVFSRQRYWGEPIPIIECDKCGFIPLEEKDLPLELPEVKEFQTGEDGESPLAKLDSWVNVKCPKCGSDAKRETDTMPQWAGSSWYFLRYVDPHNSKVLADKKKLKYWSPVDWYNGGMEHTTLHLLYSRFWHKFLYDIKVVPTDEPYTKRTSQGMILGEGSEKMSKSRGNVVNPDDVIKEFGADTFRTYEMFMGPFDQAIPWDTKGVIGVRRFLDKVWSLFNVITSEAKQSRGKKSGELEILLNKTIKKVSEDIEEMKFNTAVSALMILTNTIIEKKSASQETLEKLLILLSPFAPHIAEELWQKLGHKKSIIIESWPKYDKSKIKDETVEFVIQINGKVRAKLELPADVTEKEAVSAVKKLKNIKKYIDGKKIKKIIFVSGRLISFVI